MQTVDMNDNTAAVTYPPIGSNSLTAALSNPSYAAEAVDQQRAGQESESEQEREAMRLKGGW